MTLIEAAEYLHLSKSEIELLVYKKKIPFEVMGGKQVFRKKDLHDWANQSLLFSTESKLEDYHFKASQNQKMFQKDDAFLSRFISPSYVFDNIQAKTKNSILRELSKKAFETHMVCDEQQLLQLMIEREQLCSTGLTKGVAIPHTRIHAEYLFIDSFLLVARVSKPVPFGSQDGDMTELFFLPCAVDDKTHLYMLARLATLVQKTDLAQRLKMAENEDSIYQEFINIENQFVRLFVGKR